MRSGRWIVSIIWGTVLLLTYDFSSTQALSLRTPRRFNHVKRSKILNISSTKRRLRRRGLAKDIANESQQIGAIDKMSSPAHSGQELVPTGMNSALPSAQGNNGRELALAGISRSRNLDSVPVSMKKPIPLDLLKDIPSDIRIKSVISHDVIHHQDTRYGETTRHISGDMRQPSTVKGTAVEIEAKQQRRLVLETEQNGKAGIMTVEKVTYGIDPFAQNSHVSIRKQLEGGQAETTVNALEFLARQHAEGVPTSLLIGFRDQLEAEKGGTDRLVDDPYFTVDMFHKWTKYRREHERLALPSTTSDEMKAENHEEPHSAESSQQEVLEESIALAERYLLPFQRKKDGNDNIVRLADGTEEREILMQFGEFKILLKHRAHQDEELPQEFTAWLLENHSATLKNLGDDDWFSLEALFYNFISWLKVAGGNKNERHFLQKFIANGQESDAAYNLMYHYLHPRLNELIDLRKLTPAQKKHFKPTVSFTPESDNLKYISRGPKPMSEAELKNPYLTKEDFDKYYKEWRSSPGLGAYYADRFPEYVSDKLKKGWAVINSFFKKIAEKVRKKFPQKPRPEEIPDASRQGPDHVQESQELHRLDEHFELNQVTPVQQKYFKKTFSTLLDSKYGGDLFSEAKPHNEDDLNKLYVTDAEFKRMYSEWKKAPKPSRYHVQRLSEFVQRPFESLWKRIWESLKSVFVKSKKNSSKGGSEKPKPMEETDETKKL